MFSRAIKSFAMFDLRSESLLGHIFKMAAKKYRLGLSIILLVSLINNNERHVPLSFWNSIIVLKTMTVFQTLNLPF